MRGRKRKYKELLVPVSFTTLESHEKELERRALQSGMTRTEFVRRIVAVALAAGTITTQQLQGDEQIGVAQLNEMLDHAFREFRQERIEWQRWVGELHHRLIALEAAMTPQPPLASEDGYATPEEMRQALKALFNHDWAAA